MSRTKPNYLSAILSVALVLLLLGIFSMITLYGRGLVALFQERVDIWVELQPELPENEVGRVVSLIRAQPFVKKETVTFISREQAAAAMRKDLGDETMVQDLPNLMLDIVRFNVKAEYVTPDSLAGWRTEMKRDTAVSDLFFEATSLGNASNNIANLSYIALVLALLLIFAAVALIHNTIRLALYANRFVIKNQELVGASWQFISRPYLNRSVLNGLISAVIAIVLLVALVRLVESAVPDLAALNSTNGLTAICLILVALGVLISRLSTWWVVNKFLKMRLEDLY
jgi:cell division transport system permease protein